MYDVGWFLGSGILGGKPSTVGRSVLGFLYRLTIYPTYHTHHTFLKKFVISSFKIKEIINKNKELKGKM